MNLLVVGASHRTAPVNTLERLTLDRRSAAGLADRLITGRYVGEAVVLSTCNRVEVYAAVTGFHGGLSDIATALADHADVGVEDISENLYVRHEAQAVRHAFRVAAGLDSLVAGEAQILGQLREAYDAARDAGTASRLLHDLMQQALRVGKRVHAEAHVDAAAPSVVTAALDAAERRLPGGLTGADVAVIGAGAMGGLALSALRKRSVGTIRVVNRDPAKAARLAASYDAVTGSFDRLDRELSDVDIVISATGSAAPIIDAHTLRRRRSALLVCDLAVPRDVAAEVAELPGVDVVDIASLAGDPDAPGPAAEYLDRAEAILVEEIESFASVARAAQVAPTVAALRSRADEVMDAELARLRRRLPELSDPQRAEVAHAVHRVVRQLLHQPTVRVRQLASEPGGESYAAALRELFALDGPGLASVEGPRTADALRITPQQPDAPKQS